MLFYFCFFLSFNVFLCSYLYLRFIFIYHYYIFSSLINFFFSYCNVSFHAVLYSLSTCFAFFIDFTVSFFGYCLSYYIIYVIYVVFIPFFDITFTFTVSFVILIIFSFLCWIFYPFDLVWILFLQDLFYYFSPYHWVNSNFWLL